MTTDQNLAPEDRAALLKLHEYDELIFGGFICTHCTPEDCYDPDDNVAWPCPPLAAAGVTLHEGELIIRVRRLEIELKSWKTAHNELRNQVAGVRWS